MDSLESKAEVNWNHDVAHSRTDRHKLTHRIMRDARFSLCGSVVRDQKLAYVGAWDSGEACTCPTCNSIWAAMRRSAKREGLPLTTSKKQRARNFLQCWQPDSKISEHYDDSLPFQEALHILMPGLEYPDISHLTIAEFLKKVGK